MNKEPKRKIRVSWGLSAVSPFDRAHTTSYLSSKVTMSPSCEFPTDSELFIESREFFLLHINLAPSLR